MLQPASSSLGVPRTGGRSRFSKALPAVPPIDTSPSPTTTAFPAAATAPPVANSISKALPNPNQGDLPPPPTPLHNDDPRVPVQFTPLPPVPRKKPVSAATAPTTPTSTTGAPKMVIQRKPVGVKTQPPQPQQTQAKEVGSQASQAQPQPSSQAPKPQPQKIKTSVDWSQNQIRTPEQEQKTESKPVHVQQEQAQAPPVPPKSASATATSHQPQPQSQPTPSTSASTATSLLLSPPQKFHEAFDYQNQQPLKSPSESLSSILSAYTRSSTESVVRSSDGTVYSEHAHHDSGKVTSNHDVKESVSSIADSFPPPPPRKSPSRALAGDLETGADGKQSSASSTPPPPPSKDGPSQAARPSSPTKPLKAGPELGAPSPPRQQIWRRRSIKGSRELPDLRLPYSHGSTASTSSVSTITQKPLPDPKPSPIKASPATPGTGSAKPSQEAPPKPPAKDEPAMGSGSSKIDRLKKKFHVSNRSDDTTRSARSNHSAPGVKRPPTPEYQREEEKTPVISSFVSPVSPASSPDLQQKQSPGVSKDLPKQPQPEAETALANPISRKAVPVSNTSVLQPTKSLPDLKTKGPSPTQHEPMPPLSARPESGRNSPAPGPNPPRGRQPGRPPGPPGPPGAYPPSSRASSARPSSRGSVRPGPRPQEDRWARSPTGDLCYRGRDGTLYPEMKSGEPDPKAMSFPLASIERSAEGTVFKPIPIRQSHHNCYHRHKNMLKRPNWRYPLACQVCDRGDTQDRYACNFCQLRMCEPCFKSFDAKGRDLQALLQDPPESSTLSLSSPTRPGSALGLQVTT